MGEDESSQADREKEERIRRAISGGGDSEKSTPDASSSEFKADINHEIQVDKEANQPSEEDLKEAQRDFEETEKELEQMIQAEREKTHPDGDIPDKPSLHVSESQQDTQPEVVEEGDAGSRDNAGEPVEGQAVRLESDAPIEVGADDSSINASPPKTIGGQQADSKESDAEKELENLIKKERERIGEADMPGDGGSGRLDGVSPDEAAEEEDKNLEAEVSGGQVKSRVPEDSAVPEPADEGKSSDEEGRDSGVDEPSGIYMGGEPVENPVDKPSPKEVGSGPNDLSMDAEAELKALVEAKKGEPDTAVEDTDDGGPEQEDEAGPETPQEVLEPEGTSSKPVGEPAPENGETGGKPSVKEAEPEVQEIQPAGYDASQELSKLVSSHEKELSGKPRDEEVIDAIAGEPQEKHMEESLQPGREADPQKAEVEKQGSDDSASRMPADGTEGFEGPRVEDESPKGGKSRTPMNVSVVSEEGGDKQESKVAGILSRLGGRKQVRDAGEIEVPTRRPGSGAEELLQADDGRPPEKKRSKRNMMPVVALLLLLLLVVDAVYIYTNYLAGEEEAVEAVYTCWDGSNVSSMSLCPEKRSTTSAISASCEDGERNGIEEGVDCGGPCVPCLTEVFMNERNGIKLQYPDTWSLNESVTNLLVEAYSASKRDFVNLVVQYVGRKPFNDVVRENKQGLLQLGAVIINDEKRTEFRGYDSYEIQYDIYMNAVRISQNVVLILKDNYAYFLTSSAPVNAQIESVLESVSFDVESLEEGNHTYVNSEFDVGFRVPDSWSIDDSRKTNFFGQFLVSPEEAFIGVDFDLGERTLRQVAENDVEDSKHLNPTYKVSSIKEAVVGGREAVLVEASFLGDVRQYESRTAYITRGGKVFQFTINTLSKNKDSNLLLFDRILETISFTNKVSSTTTVKTAIACSMDSDCGGSGDGSKYCDNERPKLQRYRWTCRNPGTIDSECIQESLAPRALEECRFDEFCYRGDCIPKHCMNKVRDYDEGEEKIDCGGPCFECNETQVMCREAVDCGQSRTTSSYYCDGHRIVRDKNSYFCRQAGTAASYCVNQSVQEVLDTCLRKGERCVEGRKFCETGASCWDCMLNQGEDRVDCGGHCEDCAPIPEEYDVATIKMGETLEYNNYEIEIDKIPYPKTGVCPTGVELTIINPDNQKFYRIPATIFENNKVQGYPDLNFGYINATTDTATIWLQTQGFLQ